MSVQSCCANRTVVAQWRVLLHMMTFYSNYVTYFQHFKCQKKCVFNLSPRPYVKKCIVCAPHHEFSKKDKQQKHSLLLAFRKPVMVVNYGDQTWPCGEFLSKTL